MSDKIRPPHRARKAVLYVRQSSAGQVIHSTESQRLQYAMQDRLRELGWSEIEVIDEDLGRSAAGTVVRTGFERMVAEVCLGHVGAVAAREVSRFARNNREWQHLVEVCRMVDTLLIDQEMVYDPRLGNDRLLLGLKGSLNEYELDLLRQRAVEARLARAKRGELVVSVPVGFVKTDDQRMELDPDRRVQEAIRLVFRKFLQFGTVRQVLLWFQEEGLSLPSRPAGGDTVWKRPRYTRVRTILGNPAYAGVYAFGKTEVVARYEGATSVRVSRRKPRERWLALIRDHHEGYVTWEQFERIQRMIDDNSQLSRVVKPGAPKRGAALLPGLLRCRRCGRKLVVSYTGRQGDVVRYLCCRGMLDNAEPKCIAFGGLSVDEAVAGELRRVLEPQAIELAIRSATEAARHQDDVVGAWERDRDAARYEVERARRQFDAVDPSNRLVAAELEHRWEAALQRQGEIERRLEQARPDSDVPLQPMSVDEWRQLAGDFEAVWNNSLTDVRLKKRLVRTLIHEIVADVDDAAAEVVLVIHWQGGVHSELRVPRRRHGRTRLSTPLEIVEAVRILNRVCDDLTIAGYLNREGLRTGRGNRWTSERVIKLRRHHQIAAHSAQRQETEGWLTLTEAADRLGVATATLRVAIEREQIVGEHPLPNGPWVIHREQLERPEARAVLARAQHRRGTPAKASTKHEKSLFSGESPEEAV
jgi:DNA invertase Pin-like site-specific DNA recombinase